jgi:hypothetical protein
MNFPSEQWSLQQCLDFIRKGVDDDTTQALLNVHEKGDISTLHNEFGRWIRNSCKLWEHGTDRLVHDIIKEHERGTLSSKVMDRNQFRYGLFEISAEEASHLLENGSFGSVDYSLSHPDNCSWVLVDIFLNTLKEEYDGSNP